MAIDEETLARARAALERSDRVAADRIRVEAARDAVVLQGAVASPEEASAAALVVEQEVPAVRNELRVDVNLREDPAGAPTTGPPPAGGPPDVDAALGENLPWQPPDEPALAPTPSEQRGVADRDLTEPDAADTGGTDAADAGPAADPPSLADLSAAELAGSARGDQRRADHRPGGE